MKALHVKTFVVLREEATLYADLQVAKTPKGVVIQVRVTRQKRRGGEKLVGYGILNRDAEIMAMGDFELSESERTALETAIREVL